MKAFRVKGEFYMGDRWQTFTKEIAGDDRESAIELILSRLGSKHRVVRSRIKISDVSEIKREEMTDLIELFRFQDKPGDKRE